MAERFRLPTPENTGKETIVYCREGIMGDYDDFDDLKTLLNFIMTGKNES